MKKYTASALGLVLLFALHAFAQEHYTEGPQVTLIRVKPTQMDAYLTSLRANTKTIYDEMKKENLILDYHVFLNTTKHDLEDWDIAIGVQYKNFGALDGLTAKGEMVRDKILGSKQVAQQLGEKRVEMREIVRKRSRRTTTLNDGRAATWSRAYGAAASVYFCVITSSPFSTFMPPTLSGSLSRSRCSLSRFCRASLTSDTGTLRSPTLNSVGSKVA
jgi:hypothetical protein